MAKTQAEAQNNYDDYCHRLTDSGPQRERAEIIDNWFGAYARNAGLKDTVQAYPTEVIRVIYGEDVLKFYEGIMERSAAEEDLSNNVYIGNTATPDYLQAQTKALEEYDEYRYKQYLVLHELSVNIGNYPLEVIIERLESVGLPKALAKKFIRKY